MRTIGFTATFGTVSGYNHNNEGACTLDQFAEIWQRHMQKVFDDTTILVGCVIHDSKTVYPVKFGCPVGGEKTITVSGHYNPKFFPPSEYEHNPYLDQLKIYTGIICTLVKRELQQTTVSVTFYEIQEFVYLDGREENKDD